MSPQPQTLFSSELISATIQNQLPEGYLMRPLEITDYNKGFYDCLAGLTVVGKVSEASFQEAFAAMLRAETVYHIVVIEDVHESRIVATGTLIVEQKFLRGCGKAGHIEDIVVHDSQRGKKFGIRLIDQLKHIGTAVGCYKLLLTCSETNEPFYEKSGFLRKDLHMAQYLNPTPPATVTIDVAPTPTSSTSTATAIASSSITSNNASTTLTTVDSRAMLGGMSREFNAVAMGESVYVK
ncbi:Glucosamine-phosphate N-acetyltransferase-like protein [Podila verticillata]|nr:Glucosamine-phosphate N-acetyltransferase-like protein [Podila verticillata]KFH66286.1 glucosamine-phosphate N-acetyltransferase [Podila verticillata NRRL 6337]